MAPPSSKLVRTFLSKKHGPLSRPEPLETLSDDRARRHREGSGTRCGLVWGRSMEWPRTDGDIDAAMLTPPPLTESCKGRCDHRSGGTEPSSSTGSMEGASHRGVDGAVCDLGLPCKGSLVADLSRRWAERCGERSMSFMTAISEVADCTAASWSATELSGLDKSFESPSEGGYPNSGEGLLGDLDAPFDV